METCTATDHTHPEGANFYVTCADAGRIGYLAGPYPTHGEALAVLPAVKHAAGKADPWSDFYAFGTVAMAAEFTRPGIFNDLIEGGGLKCTPSSNG